MGGDRPIGLGIGIAVVAAFVLLPALIVPTYYLFVNVYAIVTGGDFSSDTMNVTVFLVGLVLTVALFPLLVAGAIALAGRALSPKRPDDEGE
jgi:hypothetical protein